MPAARRASIAPLKVPEVVALPKVERDRLRFQSNAVLRGGGAAGEMGHAAQPFHHTKVRHHRSPCEGWCTAFDHIAAIAGCVVRELELPGCSPTADQLQIGGRREQS